MDKETKVGGKNNKVRGFSSAKLHARPMLFVPAPYKREFKEPPKYYYYYLLILLLLQTYFVYNTFPSDLQGKSEKIDATRLRPKSPDFTTVIVVSFKRS